MASPTLGHRFDSELNRLEAEAARRKERAPSVLVGSPLSADEVRTELPVVQATFLTRQMSQSAKKLVADHLVGKKLVGKTQRPAVLEGAALQKHEMEAKQRANEGDLAHWITALIVMPILCGEFPIFRGAIIPIILLRKYRDHNWADAYCETDIAEWALSPPYQLEPRTSHSQ